MVVGFAAESRDLLENADIKLKSKGLDFIAANDISAEDAGFAVETNRVTLLFADGRRESLPLMSKTEVAEMIMNGLRHCWSNMRILVISDIHANYTALEAVLNDAGTVDETWCLGDMVGYGPDPTRCWN